MTSGIREADRGRRRGPARQLGAGLGATLLMLVVLIVPAVVMLLLSPRGIPTPLPDGLSVALLAVAGAVVGFVVRAARGRPALAVTIAALTTVLALWFQAGTWWTAGWVPTPPILPNVPPTLVLVAGVFLATALIAASGAAVATAERRSGAREAVLLGSVAAAALVAVVEGDVWGRGLLQRTFEGPWGLSRFTWLAVLFVGLLVAGALVGWVTSTVRHAPLAPAVSLAGVGIAALVVWGLTGLDGPPRSTMYGLSLGIFAVATLSGARRPAHPPTHGSV